MDTNQKWTLTETEKIVDGLYIPSPYTISLTSSAPNRKIQMSFNLEDWHDITLDIESTNEIVAVAIGPILAIKAIGAVGDVLRVIK